MTTAFKLAQLHLALAAKGALDDTVIANQRAADLYADAIRAHGLESVIVPGVRPPISFEKAYFQVFGGRL